MINRGCIRSTLKCRYSRIAIDVCCRRPKPGIAHSGGPILLGGRGSSSSNISSTWTMGNSCRTHDARYRIPHSSQRRWPTHATLNPLCSAAVSPSSLGWPVRYRMLDPSDSLSIQPFDKAAARTRSTSSGWKACMIATALICWFMAISFC